MAAFGFPYYRTVLYGFRQLQPIFQPEPKPLIALHDDFVNQFAEQLLVKALQEIRPGVKDVQQFLCLSDDLIAAGIQESLPFFCFAARELFCQLIGLI